MAHSTQQAFSGQHRFDVFDAMLKAGLFASRLAPLPSPQCPLVLADQGIGAAVRERRAP
jgi:hypothetical protein